jgi:DNA-directed RNA polymerase subunit beta'
LKESRGEVLKPETINYRSTANLSVMVFSERIFGPVKRFACGQKNPIQRIICDRCGVEVTEKKRREE